MAFGERDTLRLCQQYLDAMREGRDMKDRMHRLEQVVRFIAAVQSRRGVTRDELAQLRQIAKGLSGLVLPIGNALGDAQSVGSGRDQTM
ncbi:MAG TPA: hypothetical protein VH113_09205, partial [Gemmatimonadales bacterium]|nr:hypothetical protein [Gemmatimonadales bacterium]